MALFNKDKILNGVGKAVDVANDAADKADNYIKENNLDVKAKYVAGEFAEGMKNIGRGLEDLFKK